MNIEEILEQYYEQFPETWGDGIKDVNQRSGCGDMPLHLACLHGELEEVEVLIGAGADINAKGDIGVYSFALCYHVRSYRSC